MLAHVGAEEPPNYHTMNLNTVDHHGDLMDRSGMRQGFWLKLHTPSYDIFEPTYIQVTTHIDFIHIFRRGIGGVLGHNQEVKVQRLSSRMVLRGCWTTGGLTPAQPSPIAQHIC